MELKHERSVTIVRMDELADMYKYGTGRDLKKPPTNRLWSRRVNPRGVTSSVETSSVEKTFLNMTRGFLLPTDFGADDMTLVMAIATIRTGDMSVDDIYASLKELGCYPSGFSQAMCYFCGFDEAGKNSLGRIPHLGTIFPERRSGTAIAVTRGKELDSFVPYPYGTFKAGTQIVVIKEEKVFKKK